MLRRRIQPEIPHLCETDSEEGLGRKLIMTSDAESRSYGFAGESAIGAFLSSVSPDHLPKSARLSRGARSGGTASRSRAVGAAPLRGLPVSLFQ